MTTDLQIPKPMPRHHYHDIQQAIEETRLAELDWGNAELGQFAQIHITMPNGMDIVVQTARPIGSQAFKMFPASQWTHGDTNQVAEQIHRLLEGIKTGFTSLDANLKDYRPMTAKPLPKDPSRADTLSFNGQAAMEGSLHCGHIAGIMLNHAAYLRSDADALHGLTSLVADPTSQDTLIDAMRASADKARLYGHSMQSLGEQYETLSDLFSDAANSKRPDSDPSLEEAQDRIAIQRRHCEKLHNEYKAAREELETMLARCTLLHGESLDNFSNALTVMQSQAALPQKMPGKTEPESPTHERQLGMVLERISKMKIHTPQQNTLPNDRIWARRVNPPEGKSFWKRG